MDIYLHPQIYPKKDAVVLTVSEWFTIVELLEENEATRVYQNYRATEAHQPTLVMTVNGKTEVLSTPANDQAAVEELRHISSVLNRAGVDHSMSGSRIMFWDKDSQLTEISISLGG